MSIDPIDQACDREQRDRELCIEHARRVAEDIPTGTPGECDWCNSWSGRIVDGLCSPCRDMFSKHEAINGKGTR